MENKYNTIESNSTEITEPESNSPSYSSFFRGGLILTILAVVVLNSQYGFFLPKNDVNCILDKTFEFTAGINAFLRDNTSYRNALLISSSLCMDILIVSIFAMWFIYGRSWRILVAMLTFYGFRSIVQVI
jgi:hypothetical protein